MDISYMHNMEDTYHQLVRARRYIIGWAAAKRLQQGASEMVDGFSYEYLHCPVRTPASVVLDEGAEKK
jgi:hypothetical protein